MAWEQERRENKSSEREIKVEKDLVPKLKSHFEALAVKDEKPSHAAKAKDELASTGKSSGEKAAAAKDVRVESGKGAAGYVGKVATGVKDKTMVATRGAAEYTLEKAVDATKAVVGATATVAEYTGEKAVAAIDAVANVGVTAKDYTVDKLAHVKDSVVAMEESGKDYAAEAQRDMEAKRSTETKDESSFEESNVSEGGSSTVEKPVEKASEFAIEEEEQGVEDTGVLGVIKETIAEIGLATTEFIVGQPRFYAYGGDQSKLEQQVGKKQH